MSNARFLLKIVSVCVVVLFAGCSTVNLGTVLDVAMTAQKVASSAQDISPYQEYALGRTVGATIAGQYPTYDNQKANQYLNLLGQTLAQLSDRPETYGGYHFQILDSEEINAFAAPGGLIFVTRGLLRCTKHEDAVAAVLAHEIAHVQLKHGLRAIKKARLNAVLTEVALDQMSAHTGGVLGMTLDVFQGSIEDITTTLMNNGYSRELEYEADQTAVALLQRVGYDPNALVEMLQLMAERLDPNRKDFAKTHPAPADRIKALQKIIGAYAAVQSPASRQARFNAALGSI